MKKTNWTNNTDIRLGFEVECVIRNGFYRAFCKKVHALHPKMDIGYDYSINGEGCNFEYRTSEVRTPPLPPKDSMDLLKRLFDLVNHYGTTNASCGFHANISSASKLKMRKFEPLPFLSSTLWKEILRKFKREHNTYCRPVYRLGRTRPSRVGTIKNMMRAMDNKCWCVNMSHFRDGMDSSRVEVRAFGNRHYTQKFDLIASYIKRIEKLFNLSCEAGDIFTRTFTV